MYWCWWTFSHQSLFVFEILARWNNRWWVHYPKSYRVTQSQWCHPYSVRRSLHLETKHTNPVGWCVVLLVLPTIMKAYTKARKVHFSLEFVRLILNQKWLRVLLYLWSECLNGKSWRLNGVELTENMLMSQGLFQLKRRTADSAVRFLFLFPLNLICFDLI